MLLSVIVPFYNASKYIVKCIESIYRQNLSIYEFEVILVDDGSTDDTILKLQKIKERYSNIKVLFQCNSGQGTARNNALKTAKGKYVIFVDSDDYLLDDSIRKILKLALEYSLDICSYTMKEYDANGDYKIALCQPLEKGLIFTGIEAVCQGAILASVCTNMYKLDFIKKNKIYFNETISHEDVEFNVRLFPLASKIFFTEICAYVYCWNSQSTDRSLECSKVQKGLLSDIIIADVLKNISLNANNLMLKNNYIKRSNSVLVGLFWQCFRRRDIDRKFVKKCILQARLKRLYPFKGNALSWKATLLSKIMNIIGLDVWF